MDLEREQSIKALSFKIEDAESQVGNEFLGAWTTIDEYRQKAFEYSTFEDVDQYSWNVGDFPTDMLEGFHLISLLAHLVNHVATPEDPNAFALNYGIDRARFVTPVYRGDRMRAKGRIGDVRRRPDGILMLHQVEVEVEGRERPGFVADWWAFWMPEVPSLPGAVA